MTLFEGSLAPKPQHNRLGCQFDQMSACITLPGTVCESSLTLRTVSELGFTLLTHSIDKPLLRPALGGADVSCLELDKTPVHIDLSDRISFTPGIRDKPVSSQTRLDITIFIDTRLPSGTTADATNSSHVFAELFGCSISTPLTHNA